MTQLVPEFKAMFRFTDLFPNKKEVPRRIELLAPLHLLAELTMSKVLQASDRAIANEIEILRLRRSFSKTEEEKKRLETYRDRHMIKKLKQLDIALKEIDFDIFIEIQKVGANVTGN